MRRKVSVRGLASLSLQQRRTRQTTLGQQHEKKEPTGRPSWLVITNLASFYVRSHELSDAFPAIWGLRRSNYKSFY